MVYVCRYSSSNKPRFFDQEAMKEVGSIIALALKHHEDEAKLEEAKKACI
ncbi:hypothetical protein BsIDN1_64880 [Bacillus safensis]|uniref:Uncharacterized protein n=1 Tax=Bacillus safensis TaxID=561879 RepID=A0A5S9MHC2_BACIA|nr:hypothetical protein BsIDN1_64880 [Bacillus safensis]